MPQSQGQTMSQSQGQAYDNSTQAKSSLSNSQGQPSGPTSQTIAQSQGEAMSSPNPLPRSHTTESDAHKGNGQVGEMGHPNSSSMSDNSPRRQDSQSKSMSTTVGGVDETPMDAFLNDQHAAPAAEPIDKMPKPVKLLDTRLDSITQMLKSMKSYYQTLASTELSTAQSLRKTSTRCFENFKGIDNLAPEADQGIVSVYKESRASATALEASHMAREKFLREHTIHPLDELINDVKRHRKYLKDHSSSFKNNNIDKQRARVRKEVDTLNVHLDSASKDTRLGGTDPYLQGIQTQQAVSKQARMENEYRSTFRDLSNSHGAYEASIVSRLKDIILGTHNNSIESSREFIANIENSDQSLRSMDNCSEYRHFLNSQRGTPHDPCAPELTHDDIPYQNKDNPLLQARHQGVLQRKGTIKGWKKGQYVITPSGWLHGYPIEGIIAESRKPDISLHVMSSVITSSAKYPDRFTIAARQGSGILRKHPKCTFRTLPGEREVWLEQFSTLTPVPIETNDQADEDNDDDADTEFIDDRSSVSDQNKGYSPYGAGSNYTPPQQEPIDERGEDIMLNQDDHHTRNMAAAGAGAGAGAMGAATVGSEAMHHDPPSSSRNIGGHTRRVSSGADDLGPYGSYDQIRSDPAAPNAQSTDQSMNQPPSYVADQQPQYHPESVQPTSRNEVENVQPGGYQTKASPRMPTDSGPVGAVGGYGASAPIAAASSNRAGDDHAKGVATSRTTSGVFEDESTHEKMFYTATDTTYKNGSSFMRDSISEVATDDGR